MIVRLQSPYRMGKSSQMLKILDESSIGFRMYYLTPGRTTGFWVITKIAEDLYSLITLEYL